MANLTPTSAGTAQTGNNFTFRIEKFGSAKVVSLTSDQFLQALPGENIQLVAAPNELDGLFKSGNDLLMVMPSGNIMVVADFFQPAPNEASTPSLRIGNSTYYPADFLTTLNANFSDKDADNINQPTLDGFNNSQTDDSAFIPKDINLTNKTVHTDISTYEPLPVNVFLSVNNSTSNSSTSNPPSPPSEPSSTLLVQNETLRFTEDGVITQLSGNALSNDTGSHLSISHVNNIAGNVGATLSTAYGSLNIGADGTYQYTLNNGSTLIQRLAANEVISESIDYRVTDGTNYATGQLVIYITGTNDAPTAINDTNAIVEDSTSITGSVVTNDTDIDNGDTFSVVGITRPTSFPGTIGASYTTSYGNIILNSDGTYSYSLNNSNLTVQQLAVGQTLIDTLTYSVQDSQGATSTATLAITINGRNDAPTAINDSNTIVEDSTSITGSILTNDTDRDSGDTLSVVSITRPTTLPGTIGGSYTTGFGNIIVNSNGTYTYSLNNSNLTVQHLAVGETFTDVLLYSIQDSQGASSTATLTITISGNNDAPLAVNDSATIQEDTAIGITGSVLTNDTDADTHDTHTVSAVNGAPGQVGVALLLDYGTLTLNSNGNYSYSINNSSTVVQALSVGDTLYDTVTYVNSDNNGGSSPASLTITITGRNDAPVGVNDSNSIAEDSTRVNGNVLTNDTDVDAHDTHSVSSIYRVLGGGAGGSTLTGSVGATFSGSFGTIVLNSDGSYTYSLNNASPAVQQLAVGQSATDSFIYGLQDNNGGSSSATLVFTINGTNDAPIAINDGLFTGEDSPFPVTGNALTNDTDVDVGDTHTVTAVNNSGTNVGSAIVSSYGTLTLNSNGSYTYLVNSSNPTVQALASGQSLIDTFTYVNSDNNGGSSTGTLTARILGSNDAPVVNNETISFTEDNGVLSSTISNVLSNDSDVDNGAVLTVSRVNGLSGNVGVAVSGTYGSILINANGAYTYTLNNTANAVQNLAAGQTATEVFVYHVSDGLLNTPGTVNVVVSGTNDLPIAVADNTSVGEDGVMAPLLRTGNFLTNDTDKDTIDTHSLTAFGTSVLSLSPIGSGNTTLTTTYGQVIVNSSGAYTYTINNVAAQTLSLLQQVVDTVFYVQSDNHGGLATGALNVTLIGVNDNPVANNDSLTTTEDNIVTVSAFDGLLANDSDIDVSDTITVFAGSLYSSLGAFVTLSTNGSYTYDPSGSGVIQGLGVGQTALDSFVYSIIDGRGGFSQATAVITLTGLNDAPVAQDDNIFVYEDSGTVGSNLLVNDTDADATHALSIISAGGSTANIGVATASTYGTYTITANGDYMYHANSSDPAIQALGVGDTLMDTITYIVSDDIGATDTGAFIITILGTNDAPSLVNDNASTGEDTILTIAAGSGILANDSDIDSSDILTLLTTGTITTALNAILVLNSDGSYTYDPTSSPTIQAYTAGEVVTDTITYTVTDSHVTSTATLNIVISGFADTLTGDGGNNTITGDAGNNVIAGLNGNDVLDGGSGTDTADYSAAPPPGGVTVNLSGSVGTATGGAGNDTLLNFENIIGSNYNDTLIGDNNVNTLSGGAGDDTLIGNGGADRLLGGSGNDVLNFDSLDSKIDGGGNFDTLVLTNGFLDLQAFNLAHPNVITDIELIDMRKDPTANSLNLSIQDVLDASSSTNTLFVTGDAFDTLTSSDSWTNTGLHSTVSGIIYDIYTASSATLYVDQNIGHTSLL